MIFERATLEGGRVDVLGCRGALSRHAHRGDTTVGVALAGAFRTVRVVVRA